MYSDSEEQGLNEPGPNMPPTQPHSSPNDFPGPPPPGSDPCYPPSENPTTQPHPSPNNFPGPSPPGPNTYHPQPNNFPAPPQPGPNTYHPQPNNFPGPPQPGSNAYHPQPNNFPGPPQPGPNAYHPQPNNFPGPPQPGSNTYHPQPNNFPGPPQPGPNAYHPQPNNFPGPSQPGSNTYHPQPNNFPGPPQPGSNTYHPQPNNFPGPPQPGPNTYHPQPNNSAGPPPPGPQVVSGVPVAGNPQHVVHAPPATHRRGYWSTGLFDCFSDTESCCLVFWCPCVAFGQLAEIVDKGNSTCESSGGLYLGLYLLSAVFWPAWVFGVPLNFEWIYSCTYRAKIKQDLGMAPDSFEEVCIHFWCEPCALCQEYREIKQQGYDLSLGWHGNLVLRQQRDNGMPATVVAPVSPAMTR